MNFYKEHYATAVGNQINLGETLLNEDEILTNNQHLFESAN